MDSATGLAGWLGVQGPMFTRRIEHLDGSVETWSESVIKTPAGVLPRSQGAPTCLVHDVRMLSDVSDQHGIEWRCPGSRCRCRVPWPR